MIIQIRNAETTHRLMIPTGLIMNRWVGGLVQKQLNQKGVALTRAQTKALVKATRRCKEQLKHWKLLEVTSADGEIVEIFL